MKKQQDPFNLKKKEVLRTGRRLGSKKSDIKYRQATVYIREEFYNKILSMIKKDGSLTLKQITDESLEKYFKSKNI